MQSILERVFLFQETHPLIFSRLDFWVYFAAVFFFYLFTYRTFSVRNTYLFAVSIFFYYKTSGLFVLLLLFSVWLNFTTAIIIFRSHQFYFRKIYFIFAVCVNILLLGYFKYAYFFTDSFNVVFSTRFEPVNYFALWTNSFLGSNFNVSKIILPVGISFFTFQAISYIADVYRKKYQPVKNILDFGFYLTFFPQLVAGPIVRASEFIPQMHQPYRVSKEDFGFGLWMILKGLVKKIAIADYIAVNFIDRIFAAPESYTGFENAMALYGYSLQVYCDFSGYTDIAIGLAILMGFRLPKNFNSPYKALNVGDFWKRWHMTLSSWLKDYVYIPLGGNRFGLVRMEINIFLTFLIGGLWHGANWQFVIWGGLNGIGLLIYKLWKKISPYEKSKLWLAVFWKIFITFNFITLTRIFFRAEEIEDTLLWAKQILHHFGAEYIPQILLAYHKVFLMIAFGYLTHWLSYSFKDNLQKRFSQANIAVQLFITVVVIFLIYQSVSAGLVPFIYFQF